MPLDCAPRPAATPDRPAPPSSPPKSSETRTARSPAAAQSQQPCCGEAPGDLKNNETRETDEIRRSGGGSLILKRRPSGRRPGLRAACCRPKPAVLLRGSTGGLEQQRNGRKMKGAGRSIRSGTRPDRLLKPRSHCLSFRLLRSFRCRFLLSRDPGMGAVLNGTGLGLVSTFGLTGSAEFIPPH